MTVPMPPVDSIIGWGMAVVSWVLIVIVGIATILLLWICIVWFCSLVVGLVDKLIVKAKTPSAKLINMPICKLKTRLSRKEVTRKD